ncbi:HAMP domain-containing sensor histidine kinase [Winogradskyella maritima]|uniref:histidine kinase n=1 Tax=Winogradskyella maritima TaxID=1517766 RepID=A0ABV8AEY7_9FLAO|nr:HAMP domain-containing sensor histidine kinase [Winogradskyella maritima]
MNYKSYIFWLFFRVLLIVLTILCLFYFIYFNYTFYAIISGLFVLSVFINTLFFIKRRFEVIEDFFETVKYSDFSRWFPEDKGAKDIRFLYAGFNKINKTFKDINSQSQARYVYLQKILEMVDIGIISYNLESGDVLWSNDSFREILNMPSFKNIMFLEKRMPKLFTSIFETYRKDAEAISITIQNERKNVLISDTIFKVKEESFKLIVLQDIDNTLNQNESESWKKLLSVMTHEIMNSIAPISSLADTLQKNVQIAIESPEEKTLELEDINLGIKSIKNRSDGLMKFAKTYRSLTKITNINVERVAVSELFLNIELLMAPSIRAKKIDIHFEVLLPHLELDIDRHLIDQALINLILNAVDACKIKKEGAQIKVLASQNANNQIVLKVFDNGSGIRQDILEKIFIPFFTNKATGSGIGLSLCKQIMLLHKGKILVKSVEGKGTVFSLIF